MAPKRSPLDDVLSLFSDVRSGEGARVLLLMVNVFLLLAAYYIIKTVREPMILADGSAELKAWASAGQAIALMGFVPLYSWVASRFPRRVLIVAVTGFFVVCLQLFYPAALDAQRALDEATAAESADAETEDAAGNEAETGDGAESGVADGAGVDGEQTEAAQDEAETGGDTADSADEDDEAPSVRPQDFLKVGFIFYVWVGIFSLAMVAQFWSFANDIYTRGEGDRLFPVIGIGMTAGAASGSKIAGVLFDQGFHPPAMLQVAAVILCIHGAVLFLTSRSLERAPERRDTPSRAPNDADALEGPGGFSLIARSPYLLLIAAVILLLNVVNTTGEYILSSLVEDWAVAQGGDVGAAIGGFYSDFFTVVNIATMCVQAFVVSRIVRYIGIRGVLFALPIVAFGSYALLAAGIGLATYRWTKTAENTTDYSIMNTAKALIWLPLTRAEKYKAKQAIDTFIVRLGDLGSLGLVLLGTEVFRWQIRDFALVNLALVCVWFAATFMLYRRYRQLTR